MAVNEKYAFINSEYRIAMNNVLWKMREEVFLTQYDSPQISSEALEKKQTPQPNRFHGSR
jgi:hypothetical protein